MTRYEEIKEMTFEEMTELFTWCVSRMRHCTICPYRDNEVCPVCPPGEKLITRWLNEEVDDGKF